MIFIVLSFLAYTLNVILQQKKLSEIKTDFINNMTHELKTPISTISLSADVLLKDLTLKENERLQRYLNIIKTENTRLQSQVERVLQLAKLEQGKIQLNFEKLDLHELIRKCAETFQVPIQNNDGELKLNLEASNSYINGDLVHVTNMIYNLLDNANKYSNEDPYIEINTSIEGEYILVSISDKGKGLKKEDLKYIFEKFYRVNTGNIHDVKGFGLGLYYVHEMIRVHNGKIEVESKEGEGSVFKLFFPLIK